jgi:hypothetical protein
MIVADVWGSIIKLTNDMILDLKSDYPYTDIRLIDWEAHANINELPDADLIGPTALAISEDEPEIFRVSFAMGVSTYQTDTNLFRMRDYLNRIFDRLRYDKQIDLYDANSAAKKGKLYVTTGTTLSPMTRAEVRPFQYVQVECLLEPTVH